MAFFPLVPSKTSDQGDGGWWWGFHVFACTCVFQTLGTVVTEQLGIFRCAFLSRHPLFLSKSSIITFSFLITFSLSDQLAMMFQCFIYLSHAFFLTISFNGFSLEYLS